MHAETEGAGPVLVLAHGFTQTGRVWGPFGRALSAGRRLVRVDLPGHGSSSDITADLEQGGAMLLAAGSAAGLDTASASGAGAAGGPGGSAPFDLLGYSLGARFALHAALARPDLVRRLVLIGGTAGIEDAGARERRRRRDEEMADRLEQSGDLPGFISRWLGAPMFATLRTPDVTERLRNTATGLASSLRHAGTGTQRPRWNELAGLDVPVLVLAGSDDIRFARTGERMARGLPAGLLSLVPGGGHAAHLQQPGVTARLVATFLGS